MGGLWWTADGNVLGITWPDKQWWHKLQASHEKRGLWLNAHCSGCTDGFSAGDVVGLRMQGNDIAWLVKNGIAILPVPWQGPATPAICAGPGVVAALPGMPMLTICTL